MTIGVARVCKFGIASRRSASLVLICLQRRLKILCEGVTCDEDRKLAIFRPARGYDVDDVVLAYNSEEVPQVNAARNVDINVPLTSSQDYQQILYNQLSITADH